MRIGFVVGCLAALIAISGSDRARAGGAGQTRPDELLLGMHFITAGPSEAELLNIRARGADMSSVAPGFDEYVKYMPEDLAHYSYADFWRWWYELERYKGDEQGLKVLDELIDRCLAHGMKVKIDLAHSTWWTNDKDWETTGTVNIGPVDVDDWIHLCTRLGDRTRGRMALWLLQGEANTRDYWPGMDMAHIQRVYREGSRAFKKADPGVMISVAGATPGMGGLSIYDLPNTRELMDRWVRENVAALKGHFDDVPMNYFADVVGADPYGSLEEYYLAIKRIYDEFGIEGAEIGSGESSTQWALSSYEIKPGPQVWTGNDFDPASQKPLSEAGQAWRMNESMGTFYGLGGTKFMWWGTEFAPGGGWVWRWGFRKYQDWWGIWPEANKIPGTNIVYRYDNPDGRKADLLGGWTSSPTDPYHPVWQVVKYWAQAAPPGGEAVRLPMTIEAGGAAPAEPAGRILGVASWLSTRDEVVVLLQSDDGTSQPMRVSLDLGKTGWTRVETRSAELEQIDYATGKVTPVRFEWISPSLVDGKMLLEIPAFKGFLTLRYLSYQERQSAPWPQEDYRASLVGIDCSKVSPAWVGHPWKASVFVRNMGSKTWNRRNVELAPYPFEKLGTAPVLEGKPARVSARTESRETGVFEVELPASTAPERAAYNYRMRTNEVLGQAQWFGPVYKIVADVTDPDGVPKLVAMSELGHVRLRWFEPRGQFARVDQYEIRRGEGFDAPKQAIATLDAARTEYVDTPPALDKAYYYEVVPVTRSGIPGRPSLEDNAKALSKPRIFDAEITAHNVPAAMRLGEATTVTITVKNTGSKPWNAEGGKGVRLSATQAWGIDDETRLPRLDLLAGGAVAPGQSVTVSLPYAAWKAGRFENHWVATLDVPGKRTVYFGSPLLAETLVAP